MSCSCFSFGEKIGHVLRFREKEDYIQTKPFRIKTIKINTAKKLNIYITKKVAATQQMLNASPLNFQRQPFMKEPYNG